MKALREADLTERESRVYVALLELGSTTTGPIVKKSNVPNSKVYAVLESLHDKGLVSWIIKSKTKYFRPAPPKRLLRVIKDKEKTIKDVIPLLEAKRKKDPETNAVELFEGVKAIRSLLLGLLQDVKKEEVWYGFSTGETSSDKDIIRFYEWWGELKLNAGLKDHLLITSANKQEFLNSLTEGAKNNLIQNKSLRFSAVAFPGDTAIFRNHVIIFTWNAKPTATLITNNTLAKEYKEFFEGIWKSADKPSLEHKTP